MRGRALTAGLGLALLAAAAAVPLQATTIVAARPHDPGKAKDAIRKLIAQIDDSDFKSLRVQWSLGIFSDKFGRVEGDDELRAFLADMNSFEGRPDERPYEIYRIHLIIKDKYQPTYAIHLQRYRWHAEFEDELTGGPEPAGYRQTPMTWLATFSSNDITSFREAPELYKLGIYGVRGG